MRLSCSSWLPIHGGFDSGIEKAVKNLVTMPLKTPDVLVNGRNVAYVLFL